MTTGQLHGVRVVATSDLHGRLPEVPPCDLLLIAGDLCPITDHSHAFQQRFLEGPFASWLEGIEATTIVGIAGNHDFLAEDSPGFMRSLPWTYLCDESVEVSGLVVHGAPWTPTYGDWAFMRDDTALETRWEQISTRTTILMTHGPPFGQGDLVVDGRHAGSRSLSRRIDVLPDLRLHVFGHIHEAGGTVTERGACKSANVSHVDFGYEPALAPVVFDL